MKTNAEVSKDGTLTVNTFRDLKSLFGQGTIQTLSDS